ncbi:hypothetical protein [Streptomyces sp. NPDC058066]|uniref:hypothetical protein n=1 Tax=Streptomyces sp. NPDC058066 TaxID=3346323 RepID=UPI0036EEE52B
MIAPVQVGSAASPVAPFRNPFPYDGNAPVGTGFCEAFFVDGTGVVKYLSSNAGRYWSVEDPPGAPSEGWQLGGGDSGGIIAVLNLWQLPGGVYLFWTDPSGCLASCRLDENGQLDTPVLFNGQNGNPNAPITGNLQIAYTPVTVAGGPGEESMTTGGGHAMVYGTNGTSELVLMYWYGGEWLVGTFTEAYDTGKDTWVPFGPGLAYNGLMVVPFEETDSTAVTWTLFCNRTGKPSLGMYVGQLDILPQSGNYVAAPPLSGGMKRDSGIITGVSSQDEDGNPVINCLYLDNAGDLMNWSATKNWTPCVVPVPDLNSQSVVAGNAVSGARTVLYMITGDQNAYALPQVGQCFDGQMPMFGLPSQLHAAGSGTDLLTLAPDRVMFDAPCVFAVDTDNTLWLYEPNGQKGTFDITLSAWTGQWGATQIQTGTVTGELSPGTVIPSGTGLQSSAGWYLLMQTCGNLTVSDGPDSAVVWETGTTGRGVDAAFTSDGHLEVYDGAGIPVWTSDTYGKPAGDTLAFDDGDNWLQLLNFQGKHPVYQAVPSPSPAPIELAGAEGSFVSVMSCNGFVLALQEDGNLTLCTYDGDQVWDSGTAGAGTDAMFTESSGNEGGSLKIYGSNGSTIWSSHRFGGTAGTRIQLAPTGLQILDAGDNVVFQSLSNRCPAGTPLPVGALMSAGGFGLAFQSGGDLTLFLPDGTEVWSTGTAGTGASAAFSAAGNLEVYDGSSAEIWSSADYGGTPGTWLELTSNGLQILDAYGGVVFQAVPSPCPAGTALGPGTVMSGDGNVLAFGDDGNLVLTTGYGGPVVWETGSTNAAVSGAFTGDGALELYNSAGTAVWTSTTWAGPGTRMQLALSGLQILDDNDAVVFRSVPCTCPAGTALPAGTVLSVGGYALALQTTGTEAGNLTLTQGLGGRVLWDSGTPGKGVDAAFTAAGFLDVYDSTGNTVWTSADWTAGQEGSPDAQLQLTATGVQILDAHSAVIFQAVPSPCPAGTALPVGAVMSLGGYALAFDAGDLFLSRTSGAAVWSTGIGQLAQVSSVCFDSTGNLTLLDANGAQLWVTGTNGNSFNPCGATLALAGGAAVIADVQSHQLWTSAPMPSTVPGGTYFSIGSKMITEQNGRWFTFEENGFQLWSSQGPGWFSPSAPGGGPAFGVFQSDGNLVVYSANGTVFWTSQTPASAAVLNLTVRAVSILGPSGAPIWSHS